MEGTLRYKVNRIIAENQFSRYLWRTVFDKIDNALGQVARNRLSRTSQTQRNKVLFITFQGDYTCNPKYVTEELLRRHADVDIVWALSRQSIQTPDAVPDGVRRVELNSYAMMRELVTARVIVCNSVEFEKLRVPIRKDQIIIQTWHGSLGIKRFDREHNSGWVWVKAADYCGKMTRYCISNSTFEDEVYRGSFWPQAELLHYGHPRNDLLINKNDPRAAKLAEALRQRLGIAADTKVALYAPTFRDAHGFSCYDVHPELLFDALHERFGGNWVLLLRYHPSIREHSVGVHHTQGVIDVSQYPDIQELMLLSDVAITDYSSWIYDFLLTGRPGFIYAADKEKYDNERGFYFPLESTPFPIATDNAELGQCIRTFDDASYHRKTEAFLREKGCIEDGHASERTVDKILELIGDTQ